jgi:ankyrin repeat protein
VLEVNENDDDVGQEFLENELTEDIIESIESAKSVESIESSDELEQASDEIIKMIQITKKGKLDLLVSHITKHSINVIDILPVTPVSKNDISKTPTLLHLASYFDHHDIVEYLLEQGTDPTITSKKNMTPYDLAKDKETRNIFRRYMAEHMDTWDWKVAHVPSPLTKEMEEEQQNKQKEKKKNKGRKKKAATNKKEKELTKIEEKIVVGSSESKSVVAKSKLSTLDNSSSLIGLTPEMRARIERERRARAAEARLNAMQNSGIPKPLNFRSTENVVCTMCGKSLSGLVPFERFELKFCSIECIKKHREAIVS